MKSFFSLQLRGRHWVPFFFLITTTVLYAQIPRTISYQGLLTDESGNPKPDGDYQFTFYLYETSSGGSAIWNETKTLSVSKGLFSTSLGSQTPFGTEVKFDKQYWLGIKVGNETELSPRIALTSSSYSFTSDIALNVVDGKVVKSLNTLKDNITLEGAGGTTITSNGDTITIFSSGQGGSGIQGVQNTNNTIDITNPNGPIATLNLKVPLTLSSSGNNSTFTSYNTGTTGGVGVWGESQTGAGIIGKSNSWVGTYGETSTWFGLWGKATGSNGKGVLGESATSFGVWGISPNSAGVVGESDNWIGVYGESEAGNGVWGKSTNAGFSGVFGESILGTGVYGTAKGYRQYSVIGKSTYSGADGTFGGLGYFGDDFRGENHTIGVYGISQNSEIAVAGHNNTYESFGALGWGQVAVYGKNNTGGLAGYFDGDVDIYEDLHVYGNKSFKIDHPLDPANKYLIHSCVESSDRMNIYNGNITTNASGLATVELPGYFETLNIDYRYQLTVMGQFAQAIIESKIQNNRFTIRTDKPNVEVSWQVTGVRNDEYAKQHPFEVEKEKDANEKGKYLRPELFGQPKEMTIRYVPEPEINNKVNVPIIDSPKMEPPDLQQMKNEMQNEINKRQGNGNK